MKKYNVSASKRYGQNFLIDEFAFKKILSAANIENKDVIEIGPGLGSLTHLLLIEAKSVVAYEVDREMILVLKKEIQNSNFMLIEKDFIKETLNWSGQKTLVANIPYYITSDILFKLFKNSDKFDKAIIMVQNEVADRLVARVGSKQYGKLTISANYFANIKKIVTLGSSSFFPSPKVSSAVISLTFKKVQYNKEFLSFVKQCFANRRKTLINNMKNFMQKQEAEKLLNKIGLDLRIRPQNLTTNNFNDLFKMYSYKNLS